MWFVHFQRIWMTFKWCKHFMLSNPSYEINGKNMLMSLFLIMLSHKCLWNTCTNHFMTFLFFFYCMLLNHFLVCFLVGCLVGWLFFFFLKWWWYFVFFFSLDQKSVKVFKMTSLLLCDIRAWRLRTVSSYLY